MRRVIPHLSEAWPIVFNAGSLVGAIVINSALGFVFWWLAVRSIDPAGVGLAAAVISAMALFGTLGVLGLGTLLIGTLPRRDGQDWALITAAMMAASVAGAVLGIGFVAIAPLISPELGVLGESLEVAVAFAVGTGLTAAALVLDNALIGLLRGGIQLGRNALFGVAKLAALVLILWATASGLGIFAAWIIGLAISLVIGLIWLASVSGSRHRLKPRPGLLKGLGRAAVAHHALNVALQATGQLMPLVVTAVLSTTANAFFYTASMVAYLIYMAPSSLATVFFAVGTSDPAAMVRRLRLTVGLGVASAIAGNLVLFVAGGMILGLFGEPYAREALVPLQLLALQAFTFVVREHYVAIKRVDGRPQAATLPVLLGSALKIGAAVVGANLGGLSGLALGIVLASVLEAGWMTPTVIRAARGQTEHTSGLDDEPLPRPPLAADLDPAAGQGTR